ncbi:MAG TPA: hypothetical protein VHI93_09650 [Candidatus Thermoplasmatota archaeon]|nr:hypothetical protein [Candidatus Thermoplasmatota archaeon]
MIAWGGLLLLAATPLAGAHLTNGWGSWTSALLTGDACRYGGSTSEQVPPDPPADQGPCDEWLNSGVSGTYVGASGMDVISDMFPLFVSPMFGLFPMGHQAFAFTACNLEMLSDGTSPVGKFQDEQVVDNQPTDGLVSDGTWDDGGFGGACHAGFNDYDDPGCVITDIPYDQHDAVPNDCPSFNTYGCGGTSHAEDILVGHNVWMAAACDYQSTSASFGIATCYGLEFQASPTPNELQDCTDSVTCTLDQPPSCNVGEVLTCEADGQADALNYGWGGGNVYDQQGKARLLRSIASNGDYGPDADGVPYPSDNCPLPTVPHRAVAATYVVASVEANLGPLLNDGASVGPITVDGDGKPKEHQPLDGAGEAVYSLLLTLVKKGTFGSQGGTVTLVAEALYDLLTGAPDVKYTIPAGGWIDWTSSSVYLHDDEGEGLLITGTLPTCADGMDNDGDSLTDALDPDCHTDGNPANPSSYDPNRSEFPPPPPPPPQPGGPPMGTVRS